MTVPISPGDVIDGTYVIESLLGQGGMGAVFIAREERLGRRVAIKVLLSAVADNKEAVVRFEREARSAAALHSDHVTRVLSVGRLANGAPYIVMELLEGEDLATALANRGALGIDEVIGYMTQVCDALSEAHALGIVHRDLKPANIFLARRPTGGARVKVLDFGISKGATGTGNEVLTKTTALMGTPLYMSPEQLREARNVDGRADLWALGIIMYELVSGRPPFASDALAELCVFIMTTPHEPLIGRRPHVPPALDAIVNRCLEKDPNKRFANAKELMDALARVSSAPAVVGQVVVNPPGATPLMNPSPLAGLPTEGIAHLAAAPGAPGTRARMQAPTQAQQAAGAGYGPPPVAHAAHAVTPPLPPPTPPHGLPPGAATPLMMPPQNLPRPVHAGTVDPVSNTQIGLPSKTPGWIGIVFVGIATCAVAAAALYMLVLRAPANGGGTSASGSSSATSGLVMADPPPIASSAPSSSASARSASSAAASASAAVATSPVVTSVVRSPPPTGVLLPPPNTLPPPGAGAVPAVPAVPAGGVVPGGVPGVRPPLPPSQPPPLAVPSAKPPPPPAPPNTSLMPGGRNL